MVNRETRVEKEKEEAVLRRGRNNSSAKCPKNADYMDYRMATGVEALFGYLFLAGEGERLEELFRKILQETCKGDDGE